MKKLITFFSLAFCFLVAGNVNAQQLVPNGDFSSWSTASPSQAARWGFFATVEAGNLQPLILSVGLPLFPLKAKDHNAPLDNSKYSAAIRTDSGFVQTKTQALILNHNRGTQEIMPSMFFTGILQVQVDGADSLKAMVYYQPLLSYTRFYSLTTIMNNKGADAVLLSYIQNKPTIINKEVPTKVEGYFRYKTADYEFDEIDQTGSGLDRPMIKAYAVRDFTTDTTDSDGNPVQTFGTEVVYDGEFVFSNPSTGVDGNDWEKFTITMSKRNETSTSEANRFIVFMMSSKDSANMMTAYKNRKGGVSTLTVDDITTDGNLDVKNLNPVTYPSGLEFDILPTLSNGTITVKLPTETADITVYNTQGKVVLKKFCRDGETLNIQNSGNYIVKAVAKGKQGTRNITVVK